MYTATHVPHRLAVTASKNFLPRAVMGLECVPPLGQSLFPIGIPKYNLGTSQVKKTNVS